MQKTTSTTYRDWDMLVTIVGQLCEHITEKKVNEMLNSK